MPGMPLATEPQPARPARGIILDCAPHGEIRLFLRAEWSNTSATFAERVAAAGDSGQSTIYRLEPTFLVQGRLVAPGVNVGGAKPKASKLMERGEVGWAGGTGGPDFFIYLGNGPATWLGNPHDGTIWAEVADEASMAVADAISRLPVPPTKPGQMHIANPALRVVARPWLPKSADVGGGVRILKVRGASVDRAAASCPPSCNALAHTEMHGTPVVWGANHHTDDAAACCAACEKQRREAAVLPHPAKGCTVWVYCASRELCGSQHKECWLKHHAQPWGADVAVGTSPRWTTGTAERAPANHSSGAGAEPATVDGSDLRLVLDLGPERMGTLHLALRQTGAGRARTRLQRLLSEVPRPDAAANAVGGSVHCQDCALLTARSPPPQWGSDDLPDGLALNERWPADAALVRGTLGARGAPDPADGPVAAEWPQAAVRRGSVGWWPSAGGAETADGPAFFIALAEMPHLGLSANIWAHVALEDLPALDALAAAVEAGTQVLPVPLRAEWTASNGRAQRR